MPLAASSAPGRRDVAATLHQAVQAAEALLADAQRAVAQRVMNDGRTIARTFDREQRATHGLAWLATYVEALRQLAAYAERLAAADSFGEVEELLVQHRRRRISGADSRRHSDEPERDRAPCRSRPCAVRRGGARDAGGRAPHRRRQHRAAPRAARRADAPAHGSDGRDCGLDETLDSIREEMRKFADSQVVPHAQQWHLHNNYIPLDVIAQMSELGVFSLTIPEDYGGMGLGKESMCVVSEELSRGYIGVGCLGTRSEIAAELILGSGTEEQKRKWLPKIASGEVLPTAVFTEPNTGSDLASLEDARRARRRYL